MCRDCGCETANKKAAHHHHHDHDHDHHHHHHDHDHDHHHHHHEIKTIDIERAILAKNDALAEKNREYFNRHNIKVLNLISSPGSGKTLLLEKTIKHIPNVSIMIGDQEKDIDAQRVAANGGRVLQLNTYSSCHLNAEMINKELDKFITPDIDLLIIENVGNLVCPAAFDLGEHAKVAVLSTPEGEEKPIKYPVLFNSADFIVINKIDLANILEWDRDKCLNYIRQVNAKAQVVEISAKTEEGLHAWVSYLAGNRDVVHLH
jgi:hydrogenase nickel incorporation protein HypB